MINRDKYNILQKSFQPCRTISSVDTITHHSYQATPSDSHKVVYLYKSLITLDTSLEICIMLKISRPSQFIQDIAAQISLMQISNDMKENSLSCFKMYKWIWIQTPNQKFSSGLPKALHQ